MQGFIYKIKQFMYGRNGIDGLGVAILVLSLVSRSIFTFTFNRLFYIINLLLLILFIYRVFSKNLHQRRKENNFFMKYFYKISNYFKSATTLAKERAIVKQTHKIYVCPKCKKRLKVPKGKGKIEISCPCSHKFYKRT